jgi:arsenate reductase
LVTLYILRRFLPQKGLPPIAQELKNNLFSIILKQRAGLEPGNLHPLAIEVMKEVGIDISHKKTGGVFDLVKGGKIFSYVITVCDETSAERCPIFPGITKRLHWSFPYPAAVMGTTEEKLKKVRKIRDDIRSAVEGWCKGMRTDKSSDS